MSVVTIGKDIKEKVVLESPSGERYELKIDEKIDLTQTSYRGIAYQFRFAENKPLDYLNMSFKVYIDDIYHPIKRIEKTIVELIGWKDAGGPVGFLI